MEFVIFVVLDKLGPEPVDHNKVLDSFRKSSWIGGGEYVLANKCLTSAIWKVGAIVEQTLGGHLDEFQMSLNDAIQKIASGPIMIQ